MPAQPAKSQESAATASAENSRAQRLHALFDSASGLPVSERAALLEKERKTDPTLVREVEVLLAHDSASSTFLDGAVGRLASGLPLSQPDAAGIAPDAIAGYTILREIGRGGMGVVHEARQRFPARSVAIKLIRPEFVTHQMLARFHHEADTLGLLEHVGIARLYGAGFIAADSRRPYMVMELVRGVNLREWVRAKRPTRNQLLDVFLRVCEAVEYAHRKGVVHRDLKPGNILVEESGQPKILDFGIARLTALDAGVTLATVAGQIMGTLAYMSPEQLTGEAVAVDSRSDVYALGVILYELLCGAMPVDFSDLNLTQAAVKLQQTEPALLGHLDRTLRGDLEAIAAKALEKDPARRYQAVSELSADIRRHLCGETVLARPQTAWYQGIKYARRHKAQVVAGGLLILSLLAGIVGTSWQAMRASAQREQARIQASLAEQTSGFLSRILKSPRPEISRGKDVTVREILDAAGKELADDKELDPRVAAGIWRTLGESYSSLSHYPAALATAQRLRELQHGIGGPDDRDTIWADWFYGFQLVKTQQREKAIAVLEELLPRARRVLGEADIVTIEIRSSLAKAYLIYTIDPQAIEKALALANENIRVTRATFGPDHQRSMQAMTDKWDLCRSRFHRFTPEEIGEIMAHWRRARQLYGLESATAINALSTCVETLSFSQSRPELKAIVTEALPPLRDRYGDEHLLIAGLEQQLAEIHRAEGNFAQSARKLQHVYTVRRKLEGPDALRTRMCGFLAIEVLCAARECARAREIFAERLADARRRDAAFTPSNNDHWLEFSIAWCERDLPAMRRLDRLLKGSKYEAQTTEQVAILEQELAQRAAQPPKD